MLKRATAWLDNRLKLASVRSLLLDEPIPGGASWVYVFGSVTLFFFALQLITGILLTIYYVPSPDHAYDSVQFIEHEVTFGWFIRGLHHWGASAMVIVIGLHMFQVYLYGAYKPPREPMWIAGVVLFLLVLMFAFTGYLLPWDQKAYWATQVGTNMIGTVPLIGNTLMRIARGGAELGALTLSRFFSMHALIFPWLTVAWIGLHLFILRRVGPAGPWDEARAKAVSEPFYPRQVFIDAVAILIAFLIVAGTAVWLPFPLADKADPSASDFVPVPEWYFLFYYELLKYLKGPVWEPVGTVLLPALFYAWLFALPFIDRKKERRPAGRPVALAAGAGFLLVVFLLLGVSLKRTWSVPVTPPGVAAGKQLYATLQCAACHRIHGEGGSFGPDLSTVGAQRDRDWLVRHFKNPQAVVPGSAMPPFDLDRPSLDALADYLLSLK
jgi:ubiquinol-cytochrome c reductase cytochrome b subunit